MQIHSVLKRNGAIVGFETSDSRGRHFHVGQPPAPLRTSQAAPSARCADCGRYRGMGNDPCGNCGALPIQVPQPAPPIAPAAIPMPIPPHPWYTTASATPDMGQRLDLAIAARSTGRVASFSPPPAPAPVAPLVHARVLLTFAAL